MLRPGVSGLFAFAKKLFEPGSKPFPTKVREGFMIGCPAKCARKRRPDYTTGAMGSRGFEPPTY